MNHSRLYKIILFRVRFKVRVRVRVRTFSAVQRYLKNENTDFT